MHLDPQSLVTDVWIVLVIVWLVASLGAKPSRRVQSVASRLITSGFIICGVLLLFSTKPRMGPLSWRFVPESDEVAWTGFALTLAGIALSIWARVILGSNWSGRVTIKQGHQLIRRGPYGVVRHPIYSGFLLAILGTAILAGEVRDLVGLVFIAIGFKLKSRLEESFLQDEFGAEYVNYMRRVKALVPFVV